MIAYHTIGSNRFSPLWAVVLRAAIRDGAITAEDITDGHRTMSEQRTRVRAQGIWSPSNPHGAARPSATAPHIRRGRQDHALDVNALNGAVRRLDAWVAKHGEQLAKTVSTEDWHREIVGGEAALRRLTTRVADPLAGYPADERRWIRELDGLRRRAVDASRRRVLVRVMRNRRKAIWRAAQQSGWNTRNRRARYASLLVRTK